MYLDTINMLLDTYAPLKRINKYKLKFKSKPWITLGLQKSIYVKNELFVNFIKMINATIPFIYSFSFSLFSISILMIEGIMVLN